MKTPKYFYFRVKVINKGTALDIEDASDVDVVEVVRCEGCKHYIDHKCYENRHIMTGLFVHDEDYCGWAKKKRGDGIMYEDDIKLINEWFEAHTENYGTYHNDNEYSVSADDIEEFTDFLRDKFPDMVGIRCYIGTGGSAIWFFEEDLKSTQFV